TPRLGHAVDELGLALRDEMDVAVDDAHGDLGCRGVEDGGSGRHDCLPSSFAVPTAGALSANARSRGIHSSALLANTRSRLSSDRPRGAVRGWRSSQYG